MQLIGFLLIALLSTLWLASISCLFLALPLLALGIHSPLKMLLLYRLFRLIFPARKWPKLYTTLSLLIHKYPYFQTQSLTFESHKAIPERDSSTLLAIFPHGAICMGGTINVVLSPEIQQSDVRLLGSSMLFELPGLSDMLSWCSVGKVSKRSMTSLMSKRQNLAFYPGGFEEAALYRHSSHDVFLKERKGFVKYALRYGYKISPVYTFGEVDIYHTLEPGQDFRLRLAKMKIPGILFWSKLGWLPDPDNAIATVVGDPITLPTIPNPTSAQVDFYHNKVMESLKRLFDKYKSQYNKDPSASLNIK